MAFTINEQGLAIQTFSTNLQLVLQQVQSELAPTVMIQDGLLGYQAQVVRLLGQVNASRVYGRLTPIILDDTDSDARWIKPHDYRWATAIDNFEMLRTNVNPQGEYVQAAVAAMNRAKDQEIIAGIFGSNQTGSDGTDVIPFDTTNVIPVNTGASAPTGMSMQKLIQGAKVLRRNYALMPGDMITVVLDAEQIANLQNDEEVISGLYQNSKVLSDGVMTQVMGVNIAHSEFLPTDANGYRRNPMYVKSGVVLGLWKDLQVSIDKRPDIEGLPFQTYAMLTMGATRTQEGKVVEIKNLEPA